jgi:hypothetical protein
LADKAANATTIAEEKYKFFKGKYVHTRAQLKEVKARAANYLSQLSFASWTRDFAWADGLLLGFETFQTWAKDHARKIGLDEINVEDIPCFKEAMQRLKSLGQKQKLDTIGITQFNYNPF